MESTRLVRLPRATRAPFLAVVRRIGSACGLIVFVALVVLVGRDGYVDVTGDAIDLLDALYYASVTVTTTGYGDISAVSSGSRAAAILLITPARILFLILVVSTTVEVLTEQSRDLLNRRRWRNNVKDHIVICGFGATGQAAAADLLTRGVSANEIVIVDKDEEVVTEAAAQGFVGIVGDATRNNVLDEAAVAFARAVIVAPNRDDTAVLTVLTARELNPNAHIVAGGREQENLHLLRQGGANQVIDATAAVGRMLGLGTQAPAAVTVLDELLDVGEGLELVEVGPRVVGNEVSVPDRATLIAVIRDGQRLAQSMVDPNGLQAEDRIVILRDSHS